MKAESIRNSISKESVPKEAAFATACDCVADRFAVGRAAAEAEAFAEVSSRSLERSLKTKAFTCPTLSCRLLVLSVTWIVTVGCQGSNFDVPIFAFAFDDAHVT